MTASMHVACDPSTVLEALPLGVPVSVTVCTARLIGNNSTRGVREQVRRTLDELTKAGAVERRITRGFAGPVIRWVRATGPT